MISATRSTTTGSKQASDHQHASHAHLVASVTGEQQQYLQVSEGNSSRLCRRRLSHVGRISIKNETPANLCIQSGFMLVNNSIKTMQAWTDPLQRRELVKRHFWERIVQRNERYQCTVTEDFNYFVPDPAFSMDNHVIFAELNLKYLRSSTNVQASTSRKLEEHVTSDSCEVEAEELALRDLLSQLQNRPFDWSHPLWDLTVVVNYSRGVVLYFRSHHCYADGMAIGSIVFGNLCDQRLDDPRDYGFTYPREDAVWPPRTEQQEQQLQESKDKDYKEALRTKSEADLIMDALCRFVHRAMFVFNLVVGFLLVLCKMAINPLFPEPRTVFTSRSHVGTEKRVAWTNHITVQCCREIALNLGIRATVNDVVLSIIAGALQHYREMRACTEHDDSDMDSSILSTDPVDIRMAVPVSVRQEFPVRELGNKFGFLTAFLPLSSRFSAIDRLRLIKKRMDRAKVLPEPLFIYHGIHLMELLRLPLWLNRKIFSMTSSFLTMCCSNVRAPQKQLTIMGHDVIGFSGFMPVPSNVALGCLIMSYNGHISISITADKLTIPDPETIVRYCSEEYDKLLAQSRRIHQQRQEQMTAMQQQQQKTGGQEEEQAQQQLASA